MYEAVVGRVRLNSISPSIVVTPLTLDEFNGPRGDFYKNMFAKCPAGRPGTADEIANVAELLMSERGAFISGADFLIDGGATAFYLAIKRSSPGSLVCQREDGCFGGEIRHFLIGRFTFKNTFSKINTKG